MYTEKQKTWNSQITIKEPLWRTKSGRKTQDAIVIKLAWSCQEWLEHERESGTDSHKYQMLIFDKKVNKGNGMKNLLNKSIKNQARESSQEFKTDDKW